MSVFHVIFSTMIYKLIILNKTLRDQLFGIMVSTSDYHPRGPGFNSRLYPRNVSGSIGSGTGSTQLCEDNWLAI